MSLDVPTAVTQGGSVWLNCTLDLESDDLYSVKWYKDDVEFYRHLPRDNPSGQKFDIPGIRLDLGKSVQGHVYLTETNLDSEGIYRCEASAESSFQTVEAEKELKIFVLPKENPDIRGSQSRYEVGDYVNITCKSGPSKPAAVLKWHINGKEVEPGLEISYPILNHTNGLQTTLLGLWFMVKPKDLYPVGSITLKCTATISQTYSTYSEEVVVGEKYVGAMNTLTVIAKDGPTISGRESQYRVGEALHLNCSSVKSRPAPHLRWYLNDQLVGEDSVIRYPKNRFGDGDEMVVLGLRLRVLRHHLDEREEVRLKCTATQSRVINVRSEERTLGGNHRNSELQAAENYGKVSERSSSSSNIHVSHLTRLASLFAIFSML